MKDLKVITGEEDVLDSRDIIARLILLEDLEPDQMSDDEAEELELLKQASELGKKYSDDWEFGAQFVAERYFEDYCRGLCEEDGSVPNDMPDYIVIDWGRTADNMLLDYTEINIGRHIFFIR